jgi:hypothetical protein
MEDTKDKPTKPTEPKQTQEQPAVAPVEKVVVPVVTEAPVVVPVTPVKKPEPVKQEVLTYRLNLYKGNGQLRAEIGKGVFYEMSRRHGDIIRAISNNKFHTIDEICDSVWAAERKNFNRGHDRTRKQIEEAVSDLVETGCLLTRAS